MDKYYVEFAYETEDGVEEGCESLASLIEVFEFIEDNIDKHLYHNVSKIIEKADEYAPF